MKTLDDIAQAVHAVFPKQVTHSGREAETHRIETAPSERPNCMDVNIVQVFPTPAKRFAIRIEKTATGWLSHPVEAPDSYMAQVVAMRLQKRATGSDDVRSVRNDDGLFAVAFVTKAPEPITAPASAPDKARRAKEPTPVEASV